MGRKTLSVSLEADRNYVRALGILAEEKGTTIGALTRIATDTLYGPELQPLILFFVQSGLSKDHTGDVQTSKPGVA